MRLTTAFLIRGTLPYPPPLSLHVGSFAPRIPPQAHLRRPTKSPPADPRGTGQAWSFGVVPHSFS